MSDELVLWDGVKDNGQYDIYQVLEDDRGLVLKLVSEKDGSSLELFWDVLVCGYKNVDESFWFNTLEEQQLMELYDESFITKHTFFVVKNSSLSREIEQGCMETIKKEQLFHLKIMSSNSIFDVVSWGEPKVSNNYWMRNDLKSRRNKHE